MSGQSASRARVECGAVNVNDVLVNYPAIRTCRWAAGSSRASATAHGEPGIKKYCRTESVVITRFGGKSEPTWYPYTKARRKLISRVAQAFNARDLKRRFGIRG